MKSKTTHYFVHLHELLQVQMLNCFFLKKYVRFYRSFQQNIEFSSKCYIEIISMHLKQ